MSSSSQPPAVDAAGLAEAAADWLLLTMFAKGSSEPKPPDAAWPPPLPPRFENRFAEFMEAPADANGSTEAVGLGGAGNAEAALAGAAGNPELAGFAAAANGSAGLAA